MGGGMKTVALELDPCFGERSGVGLYAYELIRRMRDGNALQFVGQTFNFAGRRNIREALPELSIPIRENRFLHYGLLQRLWHRLPIPYQRLFSDKADLHVFFNYIVPPHIAGPVLTTVHDMSYLRFPETLHRDNLKRLRDGMSYSFARSVRIITSSEFSRREIVELAGIPESKVSVIPGAPGASREMAPFETVAARYGIRGPYLLYVGTIEPRKNLVRLLHVFDRLKASDGIPHQLVLAGGKGWRTGEFDKELTALPCRQDVVLTGYVPDRVRNSLYRNAAAFVYPSLYEGFGLPPLEAMRLGCPVVCCDTASLPEVTGDAAELIDPLSEDSLQAGIRRVLRDEDYAASLAKRGRVQAGRYSWEDSAQRLRELCAEILNLDRVIA